MTTYNDKILVPNATKDGLDTIHPETNTGNVYDFINGNWLDLTFKEHAEKIATTEQMGHFMPDGVTINVNPTTGVASATAGYPLTEGVNVKTPPSYDFNDLVDVGFYSIPYAVAVNAPQARAGLQHWLIQVLPYIREVTPVRRIMQIAYVDSTGVADIYIRVGQDGVFSTSWKKVGVTLNNTLTSPSTDEAATASVAKTLSDQITALSNSKANRAQNPEVLATLSAGWTHINSTTEKGLTYCKDEFGIVRIQGGVERGSGAGAIITTLPVGYKPLNRQNIITLVTNDNVTFTPIITALQTDGILGTYANFKFFYFMPILFRN